MNSTFFIVGRDETDRFFLPSFIYGNQFAMAGYVPPLGHAGQWLGHQPQPVYYPPQDTPGFDDLMVEDEDNQVVQQAVPIHVAYIPPQTTATNTSLVMDNTSAVPMLNIGLNYTDSDYEYVNDHVSVDSESSMESPGLGEAASLDDVADNGEEELEDQQEEQGNEENKGEGDGEDYQSDMKSLTYMDEVFMPKYLFNSSNSSPGNATDATHAEASSSNTATAEPETVNNATVEVAITGAANDSVDVDSTKNANIPPEERYRNSRHHLEEVVSHIQLSYNIANLKAKLEEMTSFDEYEAPLTAESSGLGFPPKLRSSDPGEHETDEPSNDICYACGQVCKPLEEPPKTLSEISPSRALPAPIPTPSRLIHLARQPSFHNLTLAQKAKFHSWSYFNWTGRPNSEAEEATLPEELEQERMRYVSRSENQDSILSLWYGQ